MEQAFRAEIEAVHDLLSAWLNGTAPREDAFFAQFESALDPAFSMISPQGRQTARDEIVAAIKDGYGSRAGPQANFRIWIENPGLIARLPSHLIGHYEEWQEIGGATTARISTVIFCRDNTRPNALRWRHLHETWLPGHAPLEA